MEKLQNKFYYLNEETEDEVKEKERLELEKKQKEEDAKANVVTMVSEEVKKSLDGLNIKEEIANAISEAMKGVNPKEEKKDEPSKIENSIESIQKKLELQEENALIEKKESVAKKYGIDMEDLENFKDLASVEKLIEKVSSNTKDKVIKDDGYIKKDNMENLAKAMKILTDDEEYIKLNEKKSSETLNVFKNLFKKKK